MRTIVRAGGVAALVLAAAPALAGGAFFDDFDRLDSARWRVSDGWSNGAHQACIWDKSNADVADGALTLALVRTPTRAADGGTRDYACAELQSKATYGFGLYEARLKAAKGSGLVSALFTYTGPVQKTPHDEIDVEVLGRDTTRFDTNWFVNGRGENQEKIALETPADAAMTTYAFEWTPDRLRWFVDGKPVRDAPAPAFSDAPQKVFLSLWNGGEGTTGWLGRPDASIERAEMVVDWVAFTPLGERCLFPQSTSCGDEDPAAMR